MAVTLRLESANGTGNLSLDKSLSDFSDPQWDFLAVYNLLMFFAILATNCPVLAVYLTSAQLRSNTFSFYLISLLFSNVVHALLEPLMDVVLALYVTKQKGAAFCAAFLYVVYVPDGLMLQSHVLITINRIWAVTFPHGYRIRHTKTVALVLCGCVWVYVHILMVSGLIVDFAYYRNIPSADNVQCLINTRASFSQNVWAICDEFLLYVLPICVLLIAYPFIWWKTQQRNRQVLDQAPITTTTRDRVTSIKTAADRTVALQKDEKAYRGRVSYGRTGTDALQKDRETAKERNRSQHSFTVLTVLTVSAIVCWTPLVTFYAAGTFFDYHVPMLYSIGIVPWSLQPAIDPVLFAIVLPDLRNAVVKKFRCW